MLSPRLSLVDLDADVAAGFDSALEACRSLGADVVEVPAPAAVLDVGGPYLSILFAELAAWHRRLADRRDLYRPALREWVEEGETQDTSAIDYWEAQIQRREDTYAWLDWFSEHGVDGVIEPTVPVVAWERGDGYDHWGTDAELISLTSYWNWTGFPAVSLPAGVGSASGLPVGVSLIGPEESDWHLIGIGMSLQSRARRPRALRFRPLHIPGRDRGWLTSKPDVIVVGAGSAGAAAARGLLDQGLKVLLLEAGQRDTNPAIHDPTRAHELWFADEDWAYKTVPQEHAAGRQLHWPRGKVLGGSSSLNGMIWVRGTRADWDGWAELGCEGWSWDDVLPVFRRIEDFDRGASELHGEGGPVRVISDYEPAPIQQAIVAAAQEIEIPFNPDHNGPEIEGVSYTQLSIRDGVRQSTATAYLKPVADDDEPEHRHWRPRPQTADRGRSLRGGRVGDRRRPGRERDHLRRGGRLLRHDRVGAPIDAIGDRAGGPPARNRDRRRDRPPRRGQEPPRPPALPGDLQRRA